MKSSACQDSEFLKSCINNIVAERKYILPSEYIESVRYLPKSLTPKPGYYDYSYTPYLREIVDCFSPLSPVREVVLQKPAQIGATTGILESIIAYYIGCVPKPMLYVSADKELVEIGMKTKIERMLDSCGLRDKIFSQSNIQNKRRTGDTKTEKEYPGGFLHAIGARNPGKLRQMSYPVILFDELDGFPDKLGDEGNPIDLAKNRSIAFMRTRKLLYLSTPLLAQTSKIEPLFKQGDQRYYNIPCIHCGDKIILSWHIPEDKTKTGDKAGIIFDVKESGRLIAESVHYKTQCCGKKIFNHDKTIFLPSGLWVPTAEPSYDGISSYFLNSLYSPPGMYSWIDMVYEWLEAWDITRNRVKDIDKYKTFRNTKQALTFEDRGESPKYERVIAHRRNYAKNHIRNKQAEKETGSPILLLTCACDVQADKIYCDIKGWCKNGISYTIDFRVLEGETKQYNKGAWVELTKIIEGGIWTADDGKQYRIRSTFIDAGYRAEAVYSFCGQYSSGVYPIFGRDWINDGLTLKLAAKETITKAGTLVFHINTSKIKDKIAASFKTDWNEGDKQPDWRPNFPEDLRDDFFKMYEAEYKAEKKDLRTHKVLGIFWVQQPGAPNHSFDTHCYNIGCLEMIAENVCLNELGLLSLQWADFWEYCLKGIYYTEKPKEKK